MMPCVQWGWGYTAIMYHALLRRDEIARLLLKKGANLRFVRCIAEEDGNHDLARTVVKVNYCA